MSDALVPKTGGQFGTHLLIMGKVLAAENNPTLVSPPNARSVAFSATGFQRRFIGPPGRERDNQVRHAVGYLMMGAEFGVVGATLGSAWEDRYRKLYGGQVPEEFDYLLAKAAGEIGRTLKASGSASTLGSTVRSKLCGN
jgi:hypothetical protein